MPSDVRLGLVVGVGLVIAVAIVTFRKDDAVGATAGSVQLPAPPSGGRAPIRKAEGPRRVEARTPVPHPELRPTPSTAGRLHTVQENETLFSLSVRYYGDGSRSSFLFRANQDRLLAPDRVPVGTVLHIPDLPGSATPVQEP